MKQGLVAAAMFCMTGLAYADIRWSDLWRNADQQGEALLRQGNAKAAVTTYADPQRKAYAQLKAGDYAAAAKSYAALNGNEARYNEGNALALQGKLQGALDAYDAVLKNDPGHRDARHNRDLVANALKQQNQQSQQQQPDQNKSDSKQQDGKSGQSQQGQGGAGKGSAQKDQNKSGDHGKAGDQNSSGQGDQNRDGQSGTGNQQAATTKSGQTGQPHDQAQAKSGADQSSAQQGTGANGASDAKSGSATDRSALQDAIASLGKSQSGQAPDTKVAAGAAAPVSEQQIAQDQWLRAIPDDPGGLLKRKFLIEHMMRQQKEQP
jgi:Ca-activated chloride channel family protein